MLLTHSECSRSYLSARINLTAVFIGIFSLFVFAGSNAQVVELSTDSQLVTAGYYKLNWSGHAEVYQLHESADKQFDSYKVIYEGKDLARVISGKSDGDYFYRVTDAESNPQVSNIVKVTVAHHSLEYASLFFIAGAIVFMATLALILNGNNKTNN